MTSHNLRAFGLNDEIRRLIKNQLFRFTVVAQLRGPNDETDNAFYFVQERHQSASKCLLKKRRSCT